MKPFTIKGTKFSYRLYLTSPARPTKLWRSLKAHRDQLRHTIYMYECTPSFWLHDPFTLSADGRTYTAVVYFP